VIILSILLIIAWLVFIPIPPNIIYGYGIPSFLPIYVYYLYNPYNTLPSNNGSSLKFYKYGLFLSTSIILNPFSSSF